MKHIKDLKFTDLRGTKVYVDTLEFNKHIKTSKL